MWCVYIPLYNSYVLIPLKVVHTQVSNLCLCSLISIYIFEVTIYICQISKLLLGEVLCKYVNCHDFICLFVS